MTCRSFYLLTPLLSIRCGLLKLEYSLWVLSKYSPSACTLTTPTDCTLISNRPHLNILNSLNKLQKVHVVIDADLGSWVLSEPKQTIGRIICQGVILVEFYMATSADHMLPSQNELIQEDIVSSLPLPPPGTLGDHICGTLYGNCIGDAIGLLTEFMTKDQAKKTYKKYLPNLELEHKIEDAHRSRWKMGDWTDDSDQMILIIESLLDNQGQVVPDDFAQRMKRWTRRGFRELGDHVGMGIGATTDKVMRHKEYDTDPQKAAKDVWVESKGHAASNGGVMRTSVLGAVNLHSLDEVKRNTLEICKVSHYDPRCQASCVAVTTAIAIMLQEVGQKVDVDDIIKKSYQHAKDVIDEKKGQAELKKYMKVKKLSELKLDEAGKIGYTFKTMGAGFWALKQEDFRKAMTDVVMEAGDADTNAAVAGALLGCKLGANRLPPTWLNALRHKQWLDEKIKRFLDMMAVDDPGLLQSDTSKSKT